MKYYIMP